MLRFQGSRYSPRPITNLWPRGVLYLFDDHPFTQRPHLRSTCVPVTDDAADTTSGCAKTNSTSRVACCRSWEIRRMAEVGRHSENLSSSGFSSNVGTLSSPLVLRSAFSASTKRSAETAGLNRRLKLSALFCSVTDPASDLLSCSFALRPAKVHHSFSSSRLPHRSTLASGLSQSCSVRASSRASSPRRDKNENRASLAKTCFTSWQSSKL